MLSPSERAQLRLDVPRTLLSHFLREGAVGPLAFLAIVGVASLVTIWSNLLLAGVWAAIVLVIGTLMVAGQITDPTALETAVRSALEGHLPLKSLGDPTRRAMLQRSIGLTGHVVVIVHRLRTGQGLSSIHQVGEYACGMLETVYAALSRGDGGEGVATAALRDLEVMAGALERIDAAAPDERLALAAELTREAEASLQDLRSPHFEPVVPSVNASVEREPEELRNLRLLLQRGFEQIKLPAGAKALQELRDAFARLQVVLDRKKAADPLAVSQVPHLTEELYRQGLNVLRDALDLAQAIHSPEGGRLEAELVRLENEGGPMRADPREAARLRMNEETIASHRARLETIKRFELRVEELIHQARRCEASLHQTRIELAAIKVDASEAHIGGITETLKKTIQQAREVQDEFRKAQA